VDTHYDDQEHTWVDGAVANGFDIETVALHEIGHCLGMLHTNVNGSVMFPSVSPNFTLRTLQPDDLAGIRDLYPTGGWRGFELAPAGSASPNGSISVVSRIPNSMEVFWVGANGSVGDNYWYP
jgi:hypothetical protein